MKISVSYDTTSKKMTIASDDVEIPNVTEIAFNKYYDKDEYALAITCFEHDKEQDMAKMTRIMASDSEEASKGGFAESKHKGFVILDEKSKVESDIDSFFKE